MPGPPKSTQLLLDYLTTRNPLLNISASGTGNNTKPSSPWNAPTIVIEWDDFEHDALQSIHGGKLNGVLGQSFALDHFSIPRIPFCQIHDENSLDSLLIKWTQSVTCSALSAAHQCLKDDSAERIYMCRGGQAKSPGNAKCRPDWAAVKNSTIDRQSEDRARNLLPGDTRLSTKWSIAKFQHGLREMLKNNAEIKDCAYQDWCRPIVQIFTYCVRNDARYGYIITDKELVVVRVGPKDHKDDPHSKRPNDGGDTLKSIGVAEPKSRKSKSKGKEKAAAYLRAYEGGYLEYKAIPWHRYVTPGDRESTVMTINLALWWLHLMAAKDGEIQDKYAPLKAYEWATDTEPGTQSSSFAISETSQETQPLFIQKSFNSGLGDLHLEPENASSKRSRKHDDDDEDSVEQASPQKRMRHRMRGSKGSK